MIEKKGTITSHTKLCSFLQYLRNLDKRRHVVLRDSIGNIIEKPWVDPDDDFNIEIHRFEKKYRIFILNGKYVGSDVITMINTPAKRKSK